MEKAVLFATLLTAVTMTLTTASVFKSTTELTRMTQDGATGRLYVGGRNRIFQLKRDLRLEHEAITGPGNDQSAETINCYGTNEDDYNQLLFVVREDNVLVSCGTQDWGICERRNLTNIRQKLNVTYESKEERRVVPVQEYGTSIAVLVSPPSGETNVFIASSISPVRCMQTSVIISKRKKNLQYVEYKYAEQFMSFIRSKEKKEVDLRFVNGFEFRDFVYLTLVVHRNESRVGRVCMRYDNLIKTYMETRLVCRRGDKRFNVLRAATIATAGSYLKTRLGVHANDSLLVGSFSEFANSTASVICIFALNDIKKTMDSSPCTRLVTRDVSFNGGKSDCSGITDNNCESTGTHLSDKTLQQNAVYASNSTLTSLVATKINNISIVYAGTKKGHLEKVLLSSSVADSKLLFDNVIEDNKPIQSDLLISPDFSHIYALLPSQVVMSSVENCSMYETCETCRQSRDPHCGWCSLSSRCTVKETCSNSDDKAHWLGFYSTQCVGISEMAPISWPIKEQQTTMQLTLVEFPENAGELSCVFGDNEYESPAQLVQNKLTCETPRKNTIQLKDTQKDHVSLMLQIKSIRTGAIITEKEFVLYECGIHSTCVPCVSSNWGCNWCISDNRCVHNVTQCDDPSSKVIPVTSSSGQRKKRTESCPQIAPSSAEVLIPYGIDRKVDIRGHHFPVPTKEYTCCVGYNGDSDKTQTLKATYVNDSLVVCDPFKYKYEGELSTKNFSISLLWDSSKWIDYTYTVTVYKCSQLGSDCSRCTSPEITLPKYNCKWCRNTCQYQTCPGHSTQDCPGPIITNVVPMKAPGGADDPGGTEVTITGSNFGDMPMNVSVKINGVDCSLIRNEFEIGRRIVCTLAKRQDVDLNSQGKVIVTIGTRKKGTFDGFQFLDPQLISFSPKNGLLHGGTTVTVNGTSLDTGNKREIHIGGIPCLIVSRSESQLQCKSGRSATVMSTNLTVSFDKAYREADEIYRYTPNPVFNVDKMAPKSFIASGGTIVTIPGRYFDSIQRASVQMQGYDGTSSQQEDCEINNSTIMYCKVPRAPNATFDILSPPRKHLPYPIQSDVANSYEAKSDEDLESSRRFRRDVGFACSSKTNAIGLIVINDEVWNLNTTRPWCFDYVPDPIYFQFREADKIKTLHGDVLTIQGKDLTIANEESVVVTIGREICNITALATEQLVCKPPIDQPRPLDPDHELPEVIVKIGNLKFEIGYLKYPETGLPIWLLILIGVATFIIVVLVIMILIFRHHSARARQDYKQMQIELDRLESTVRDDTKQAFAELQTDMTDLTSDLNLRGIPFWNYQCFTFKVLFPGVKDHPILHKPEKKPITGMEAGMKQFSKLIREKSFLLCIIRAMEEQKTFTVREKANVAAVLMILLQDDMMYATDVLTCLLRDLIEKSIAKGQTKLLLRRTESVVEKMLTHWLSVCLYHHLMGWVGPQLFMLVLAIKHQVEKGPIDIFTNDARYSLSEDRLLREKLDPKMLNLDVILDDGEVVPCRALDCDAIIQVKEKMLDAIYKNTQFSHRPSIHDLDLEWRSGQGGHLVLPDDDVVQHPDGPFKRLTTLGHYGVPDDARMTLVPRQHDSLNRSINSSTCGTSDTSITPILDEETGLRIYHLVRPHDENLGQDRNRGITEIHFPRMLITKHAIQPFVDDLFKSILTVDENTSPAIKYLFDFLDLFAKDLPEADEVLHLWKNNSLPLRFWATVIKNPNFLFDIHKSPILDSCLTVICQTFMDSCSTSELRLGKDSPSNKLLYAKDIPGYKEMVNGYYESIQQLPAISDQDLSTYLGALSRDHPTEFNLTAAAKELFEYVSRYFVEICEVLEQCNDTSRFVAKLEQIKVMAETDNTLVSVL
ncbi:plexin-B-like isoform X2 [Tubulanus polymorphus]|uniref:plexin-B-like isoform X2 n=1 Tax=Tubulanus polymorphus TaxID=672921 RepID=UPI003DA23493